MLCECFEERGLVQKQLDSFDELVRHIMQVACNEHSSPVASQSPGRNYLRSQRFVQMYLHAHV